ncbi:hypothetical protein B0T24DRAFT_618864 [Lasiosphaeria ovina]|uniref:Uncharacterized protein n=1 Tax=Lasiosphaeria ovina TaxID=92902 RepID=A0AAE0NBG8_9PEZI|nr:hypothetical protein B0T24DRAFT_618864 [Lasiosphaeria ovina]
MLVCYYKAREIALRPENYKAGWHATGFYSTKQSFPRAQQYQQAILDFVDQVAFLYDVEAKLAWLVPSISLLLHLCQVYFHTKKLDQAAPCPIPFAKVSANGSKAAEEVFRVHGETVVAGMKGGGEPRLGEILLRLQWSLDGRVQKRQNPKGSTVFGPEMMDMIQRPGAGSCLKFEDVTDEGKAWMRFVQEADIVVFCRGLGNAIEPQDMKSGSPCSCHQVPNDRHLLVAHNWCLEKIMTTRFGKSIKNLQRGSCVFGDNYVWKMDNWPFNMCDHTLSTS